MGGINTTGIILLLALLPISETTSECKKLSNQTRGISLPGSPILWSCQCGPTNVRVGLSSASVGITCVSYIVWVGDGICGTKSCDVLWR